MALIVYWARSGESIGSCI